MVIRYSNADIKRIIEQTSDLVLDNDINTFIKEETKEFK